MNDFVLGFVGFDEGDSNYIMPWVTIQDAFKIANIVASSHRRACVLHYNDVLQPYWFVGNYKVLDKNNGLIHDLSSVIDALDSDNEKDGVL